MKSLIKRYPNIAYFCIAFGWTWIMVFGLIISGSVKDVSTMPPSLLIVGLACNVAPSIAAFIVTGIAKGREGISDLKARFKKKSTMALYLLAGLTVPAVTLLTTVISSQTIRTYKFSLSIPLIIVGFVWPLFSGFGEEFGWRGFLLPQLLTRYGSLKAGILLGMIWAIWHIPMDYIGYQSYGPYLIPAFLVMGLINLTLHSVIMTYLFEKSEGSIKLMVLYHYTITGSSILLGAFFKAEDLPRYSVCEGIVFVTLSFLVAVFLYLRKRINERRIINA